MKVAVSCTLTVLSILASGQAQVSVGDRVCIEGFVMDDFCIQRTTLFDNPSVVTLENPELHSVHCLVDVPSCVQSDYEILVPNPSGSPRFARGWRLDTSSKELTVSLARLVGGGEGAPPCSTCNGNFSIPRGFRIATNVTVLDLGTANRPALVGEASNMIILAFEEQYCGTAAIAPPSMVTVSGSNLDTMILVHGSIMLIAWGWILPSGVLIAKLLKHRPDGLWFKIHRTLQPIGLFLALVGWIIALRNFKALQDVGHKNYKHAVMGMTVMIGGLLQPFNAVMRPDPSKGDQPKTNARKVWEVVHKGLGWIIVLLALATIGLGTTIVPTMAWQRNFQIAFGAGCGCLLALLIALLMYDRIRYKAPTRDGENQDADQDEQM